MNVKFPKGEPVIELLQRDEKILLEAMGLCRHAGLVPGKEDLAKASVAIRAFLVAQGVIQEKQDETAAK